MVQIVFFLKLLENYSIDCRSIVLNCQTSPWQNIWASVPQRSVLGSLLFSIYINDLPDGIASLCKIFADDTSLFSKVNDENNSNTQLKSHLERIRKLAFQLNISLSPDTNKQATKVCLYHSCSKKYPLGSLPIYFI